MFSGSGLLHTAVAAKCRQYCPDPSPQGACFGLASLVCFGLALIALVCCCGLCSAGAGLYAWRRLPLAGAAAEPPSRPRRRLEGYRVD